MGIEMWHWTKIGYQLLCSRGIEKISGMTWVKAANPFNLSVAFHIESSNLICSAKQMTSFYMKRNTGLKRVNRNVSFCISCSVWLLFKKAHAGKNYLVNFFSIKSAAQYLKLPKRANVQISYIGLPNIKKTLLRTTFSGR